MPENPLCRFHNALRAIRQPLKSTFAPLSFCRLLGRCACRGVLLRLRGSWHGCRRLTELAKPSKQRAALPAGTTTDSTWAQPLALYEQRQRCLRRNVALQCVRQSAGRQCSSCGCRRRARVVVTTAGASGYIVGEGAPKPATVLAMTAVELAMSKVSASSSSAEELLRGGGVGALNLLGRELRAALALVTDEYFIGRLTTGLTAIPSCGLEQSWQSEMTFGCCWMPLASMPTRAHTSSHRRRLRKVSVAWRCSGRSDVCWPDAGWRNAGWRAVANRPMRPRRTR